jgi:hypothetical protein
MLDARCRDPRVKVLWISFPADQLFRKAGSDPLVQYFIYLIDGASRDANRSQFLLIQLANYLRFILIFQLLDGSRNPANHFCDAEYFGAEILFRAFRKLHLLFADTHVLTPSNSRSYSTDATSPIIHPLPYREDIGVRYFGGCRAHGWVYRVVVSSDKFWENVDIPVRVFIGEVFIEPVPNCPLSSLHDRAFNVGIFTYLKLNALTFQRVLKLSV